MKPRQAGPKRHGNVLSCPPHRNHALRFVTPLLMVASGFRIHWTAAPDVKRHGGTARRTTRGWHGIPVTSWGATLVSDLRVNGSRGVLKRRKCWITIPPVTMKRRGFTWT